MQIPPYADAIVIYFSLVAAIPIIPLAGGGTFFFFLEESPSRYFRKSLSSRSEPPCLELARFSQCEEKDPRIGRAERG
jgi:hypothetical protein